MAQQSAIVVSSIRAAAGGGELARDLAEITALLLASCYVEGHLQPQLVAAEVGGEFGYPGLGNILPVGQLPEDVVANYLITPDFRLRHLPSGTAVSPMLEAAWSAYLAHLLGHYAHLYAVSFYFYDSEL